MSIVKRLSYLKQDLYDRFICTASGLSGKPTHSPIAGRSVTVAIPHYNRGALIHQALHNALRDGRVNEIIIVDDGSKPEQYELLKKNVDKFNSSRKIHLHRREENRGAMWTKMECVEKSSNPWVILLDADNSLFQSYLDEVFALPAWEKDTIYCPSYAFPHFDFRTLAGRSIDFEAACDLTRSGVLRRVYILNDGNYFLNRGSYLATLKKLYNLRNDVADVMVVNYLWLSEGKKLKVMHKATYCHRLSSNSFWSRTAGSSRDRVLALLDRLDKGLLWDAEMSASLQTKF